MLAGVLEEGIERTDDVLLNSCDVGYRAGKLDEAFEGISQMFDAVEMVAKSLCLHAGADYEHVARIQTAVETPIEEYAIDQPAQTQGNGDQKNGGDHDDAGNIVGVRDVERPRQQQT